MEVLWISIATCFSLITLLIGCLRCRRKLSDEEVQRKYFEKFRKRHMLRDRILSNRVDYIRSVSEGKTASCMNSGCEYTYEEMSTPPVPHPPIIQVEEASPLPSSDYSFFDDSFQTVIEASSSNTSSLNSGLSKLLTVTNSQHASYLSLQNNSQACLRIGTAEDQIQSENEGEINAAFSDNSGNSAVNSRSADYLSDSYIEPSCGPKIRIIQPSVKRKLDQQVPVASSEADVSDELQLHVNTLQRTSSAEREVIGKNLSKSTEENTTDRNEIDACGKVFNENCLQACETAEKLKEKKLQKLAMEGPIHNERKLSSESAIYEMLRSSRTEQYIYKSLHKTALVLPGRPRMCPPIVTPEGLGCRGRSKQPTPKSSKPRNTGSTGSRYSDHTYDMADSRQHSDQTYSSTYSRRHSDHTYDSITCELAFEINRRDSVSSVENKRNNGYNYHTSRDKILTTPAHRGSYTDTQNDLSAASPEHTYESIGSPIAKMTEATCDNSAVIIGRRVSNPFDSNKFSKRMINKKKQRYLNDNTNQSSKKVHKDKEERYSPFPVPKKLAFKSAFKQVSSPRFSMIQTVSGNGTNQLGNQPEICVDNLNIKTPEIKVDNCTQFFDNTAFISPYVINANTVTKGDSQKDTIEVISPMCSFQGLKNNIHSKVSNTNLKSSLTEKHWNHKKSLPSLSDHLEEEILRHCNANIYTRSTPCDLDMQNCNFF